MGDIIQVILNPKDTIRSLIESRRLLEEARQEISQTREDSQVYVKPKISRLPGFFPREQECSAIERVLDGQPSFTVIFGASLVGKTAMLKETLSGEKYHVLYIDLRLAGFADIQYLYTSLCQQMELYFMELAKMAGYRVFETEAQKFKRDRFDVKQRISNASVSANPITTSDIARLMELFQTALLIYSEFNPSCDESEASSEKSDESSDRTRVEPGPNGVGSNRRWGFRFPTKGKARGGGMVVQCSKIEGPESEKEKPKPAKKIPVVWVDEAHKLSSLVQSTDTMKCLLDSMLVLTKQDRLCHVIHTTSDPFYQTTLRQFNVMHHCKTLTIGDCSKSKMRTYFNDWLLARVPESLRGGLDFESLYDAFGGRLAHWHEYITDYVDSNGDLDVKRSSNFLQAHSFLNLHIIHSSQASAPPLAEAEQQTNNRSTETLHPGLGPAGLKACSPTSPSHVTDPRDNEDRAIIMVAGYYDANFTAMQLLKVMSRLTQPGVAYLPYFLLCREIGVRAVDGMVRGKVLDLRWTETLAKEGVDLARNRRGGIVSGTVVDGAGEGTLVFSAGQEIQEQRNVNDEEFDGVVVGPKLVPITPIMRYAMREVVQEYEDEQSVSEYASLSDVDEY